MLTLTRRLVLPLLALFLAATALSAVVIDLPADERPKADSKGVAIRQDGLAEPQAELEKRITSAPARVMKASGLAGAMGGARVKVTATDPQEIILPVPQLTGGQVPLSYFIAITPAEAATEFRLRAREDRTLRSRGPRLFYSLPGTSHRSELPPNRIVRRLRAFSPSRTRSRSWPRTFGRSRTRPRRSQRTFSGTFGI